MSALERAARQALEALEHVIYWDNENPEWEYAHASITSLREALEGQTAQAAESLAVGREPVAWYEYSEKHDAWFLAYSRNQKAKTRPLGFVDGEEPHPSRHPLTEAEIATIVKGASSGALTRRDGTATTRIVRAVERAHGITGGQS